jgi:hypothetical protein
MFLVWEKKCYTEKEKEQDGGKNCTYIAGN